MTVQELIEILLDVKNPNQAVVVCVHGVEVGETIVEGVRSEEQEPGSYGICWLEISENSVLHETY